MTKKKRNDKGVLTPKQLGIQRRQSVIAGLRLRGFTIRQIRENLAKMKPPIHVGESTISRDLRMLGKEWEKSARDKIGRARGLEAARLDLVLSECFIAWEKDKHPSHMRNALGAIQQRRQILGLDAGHEEFTQALSGLVSKRLEDMTDEELAALIAAQD